MARKLANIVVMGSPGKIVKTISEQQKAMLEKSAEYYVTNAKRFAKDLKADITQD